MDELIISPTEEDINHDLQHIIRQYEKVKLNPDVLTKTSIGNQEKLIIEESYCPYEERMDQESQALLAAAFWILVFACLLFVLYWRFSRRIFHYNSIQKKKFMRKIREICTLEDFSLALDETPRTLGSDDIVEIIRKIGNKVIDEAELIIKQIENFWFEVSKREQRKTTAHALSLKGLLVKSEKVHYRAQLIADRIKQLEGLLPKGELPSECQADIQNTVRKLGGLVHQLYEECDSLETKLEQALADRNLDALAEVRLRMQILGVNLLDGKNREKDGTNELLRVVDRRLAHRDPNRIAKALQGAILSNEASKIAYQIELAIAEGYEDLENVEEAKVHLTSLYAKAEKEIQVDGENEIKPLYQLISETAAASPKGFENMAPQLMSASPTQDPALWGSGQSALVEENGDENNSSGQISLVVSKMQNASQALGLVDSSLQIRPAPTINQEEVTELAQRFESLGISAEKSREKAVDELMERSRQYQGEMEQWRLRLLEMIYNKQSKLKERIMNHKEKIKADHDKAVEQVRLEKQHRQIEEDQVWQAVTLWQVDHIKTMKQWEIQDERHRRQQKEKEKVEEKALQCTQCLSFWRIFYLEVLTFSLVVCKYVSFTKVMFGHCSADVSNSEALVMIYFLGSTSQQWPCYLWTSFLFVARVILLLAVGALLKRLPMTTSASAFFFCGSIVVVFQDSWAPAFSSSTACRLCPLFVYNLVLYYFLVYLKMATSWKSQAPIGLISSITSCITAVYVISWADVSISKQ